MTWGHTPAELAVDFAIAAGVKRVALFHHDPSRTDDMLDRLVDTCRRRAASRDGSLEIFGAAEGQIIELVSRDADGGGGAQAGSASTVGSVSTAPEPPTILIVDDDPEVVSLLTMTLEPEGFRLLSAGDGEAALEIARAACPDLLLLDWTMPGKDGLEVCRALRAESNPRLRHVPVILLTARVDAQETAAGFAAGVTDYVTKPFKPTHIRSRVHAWLQRSRGSSGP